MDLARFTFGLYTPSTSYKRHCCCTRFKGITSDGQPEPKKLMYFGYIEQKWRKYNNEDPNMLGKTHNEKFISKQTNSLESYF